MRAVLCSLSLLFASVAFADDPAGVEVGKPAPAFTLPATQIEKVLPDKKDAKTLSLSDFSKGANGKNVVLFFFPKAMTGG